jgi:hypothetical protein
VETKKTNGLKNRAILGSIIILLIVSGVWVIAAPSFNTVVEPGGMVSGAAYTIFEDGGLYYRRDGTTGEVTTNVDAATLIQACINAAPVGGLIVSKGNFTISTSLTFDRTISYEHYGVLNSTVAGGTFIIGSAATNPTGGKIYVTLCIGPNTPGSSMVKQISGIYWDINIQRGTNYDIIWEFAPVAQGSDIWYAGNRLTGDFDAITNIWYMPVEPAHVFIEGNKLDVAGTCHASLPILFEGGTQNQLYGFAHSIGASTVPDIDDHLSRGYNTFIVNYLEHPDYVTLEEHSVLIYPKFSIIPNKDTASSHNLILNGDFEDWSGTPLNWAFHGTITQETGTIKILSSSVKVVNIIGDEAYVEQAFTFIPNHMYTFNAWVYCSNINRGYIKIFDSVGGVWAESVSRPHPGDGEWHLLTVSKVIRAGAIAAKVRVGSDPGAVITCYTDGAICVEGNTAVNLVETIPNTDVLTYPEEADSYVVWNDTLIYAKNGHTGAVTSNANATILLQSCVTALPNGGLIFVKAGNYPLDGYITLGKNIHLQGEGISTVFSSTTDNRLFVMQNLNNTDLDHFKIEITNVARTESIIRIISATTDSAHLKIHDVTFEDTNKTVPANYYGMDFYICSPNGLTYSSFYNLRFDAIPIPIIATVEAGAVMNANLFQNIVFKDFKGAFNIMNGAGDFFSNTVQDCQFETNNVGGPSNYCILMGVTVVAKWNNFINNDFWNQVPPALTAYQFEANATENVVIGGHIGPSLLMLPGTNNRFTNLIGYVTENSGTATLLNTTASIYVPHGCDFIPTAQQITITYTENPTNAATYWYVGNCSATGFTLYHNDPGASNLDFGWSVDRIP